MTEPVTPKADRRVIDGEVVEPTTQAENEAITRESQASAGANARRRAHNRNQQTTEPNSQEASKKDAPNTAGNKATTLAMLSKPWVKKSIIWGSFFIMVAAILLYTRPNMDWQIEHINRLQAQVAKLQETNKLLVDKIETQQTELDARISEVLNRPENQPLITKADLEAIKTDTKQQLTSLYEQVQTDLTAFNNQAETKLQALSEQAKTAMTPSDVDLSALTAFQKKVEAQLSQVGEEIGQLFTFKQQQEQQAQQAVEKPETLPEEKALQNLTNMQVQQWILEINNQWLLKGDAEITGTQLLAVEQALAFTEMANKTEIARTIGQDLSTVKAYSEQSQQASQSLQENLKALSNLVNAIPQPEMGSQQTNAEPTTLANTSETDETQVTTSPLDLLLAKFTGLISVKKRESEAELSSVEGLLLHDVLMQRLALLVDRVQWAASIQSTSELQKASVDVQAFIDLHFKAQSQAFEAVLVPLKSTVFSHRKPLAVVSVNAA